MLHMANYTEICNQRKYITKKTLRISHWKIESNFHPQFSRIPIHAEQFINKFSSC